jgi:hypothetical protein
VTYGWKGSHRYAFSRVFYKLPPSGAIFVATTVDQITGHTTVRNECNYVHMYAECLQTHIENMNKLEVLNFLSFFCGARYKVRFLPPANHEKMLFEEILTAVCVQVFWHMMMCPRASDFRPFKAT